MTWTCSKCKRELGEATRVDGVSGMGRCDSSECDPTRIREHRYLLQSDIETAKEAAGGGCWEWDRRTIRYLQENASSSVDAAAAVMSIRRLFCRYQNDVATVLCSPCQML